MAYFVTSHDMFLGVIAEFAERAKSIGVSVVISEVIFNHKCSCAKFKQ